MKPSVVVAVGGIGVCLLTFCANQQPPLFDKPANFPEPTYKFSENPLTADGVALGKTLFYDALLSKDNTISCGSCHQQSAGFTQHGHALSHGINDLLTKRNSMPLFNLAWSGSFGWDGGVHHLDLFPLVPLQNPSEMDESLAEVLEKLRKTKTYPPLFTKAFGSSEINTERFLKSLSQFMLTMVSANSRYDRAVRGEGDPLTATEQEGLVLVQNKCGACHSGALFTDGKFHNNGLEQSVNTDEGRVDITLLPEDRYTFKTPSLRNLMATAPYMHDGRLGTLEQVLDHYTNGVKTSSTLDPILRQNGQPGIALTASEKSKIIAFLKTLTDEQFLKDNRLSEFSTPEPTEAISQVSNKVEPTVRGLAVKESLSQLLTDYLTLKNALVQSDGATAKQTAKRMGDKLATLEPAVLATQQQVYSDLSFDVEHIAGTQLVTHQRDHFSDLSKNLFQLLKAFNVTDKQVYCHFCEKALYNQGGYWLTDVPSEAGNPFFGTDDTACGTIAHTLLDLTRTKRF